MTKKYCRKAVNKAFFKKRSKIKCRRPELEATGILRKALNGLKPEEAVDKILDMFTRTRSNTDFVNVVRKMKIL